MSKEFLKSSRTIDEILPSSKEDRATEVTKYSGLLAEQQRGYQRAMSKGDRKSADRIKEVIKNLQIKYDKVMSQLHERE